MVPLRTLGAVWYQERVVQQRRADQRRAAFLSPRRLVSLEAYNGGAGATTVTASRAGQSASAGIPAGQKATLATGWSGACTTILISSSNGWNTNFDNLTLSDDSLPPVPTQIAAPAETSAPTPDVATPTGTPTSTPTPTSEATPTGTPAAAPTPTNTPMPTATSTLTSMPPASTPTRTPLPRATVTFNDKAGQNRPLTGEYPGGVISWGASGWYHSGPWRKFTTKSVSPSSEAATSETFTFVTPRRLVSLQAFNGRTATTTVTIACAGQTSKTATLAANAVVTIATGWVGPCSTVTVWSSNGWDTNFDNLVYDSG